MQIYGDPANTYSCAHVPYNLAVSCTTCMCIGSLFFLARTVLDGIFSTYHVKPLHVALTQPHWRHYFFTLLFFSQNVPFHEEGGPHQRPVVFARSQLHIRAAPRSKCHGRHPWSSGSYVPILRSSTSRHVEPMRKSTILLPGLSHSYTYHSERHGCSVAFARSQLHILRTAMEMWPRRYVVLSKLYAFSHRL